MQCPSCRVDIPEGNKFCHACGAAVPVGCPCCGTINRSDAKFCSECGRKLTVSCLDADAKTNTVAPASAASAERRQLTIMFCDLVGSMALSQQLDPEDLREVIGAYRRCCAEAVVRSGGLVATYVGDSVLAYFGYPQAHEDDAERAVRAALAMIEAVDRLDTRAGSKLQVRVGIATGLVVVGDLIGEGWMQQQAVMGDTPSLAARLQALAEPNTVVIAGGTRRLLGELFEYRDLGAVPVKGFAEAVPAWQVTGVGAVDSRFEALRTITAPLVGRDEEIELLMRRWQQAKGGEGCVVLISGEPGIGKSRLAKTLLERLSIEPHTRLRYFSSPHHQDSALYPFITQLERAAGLRREDTDEKRLDKLETVLAPATGNLNQDAPLLAALLSIPAEGRYPPLDLAPHRRKEETLQVLVRQVEGRAARQPLLIVFEDAHWVDPTSLEALDLFIDRAPSLPVLLIITFRPEFTPPWIGRSQVSLVSLNRLTPRQRAEMIVHVTSGKVLPKEIADQIIDRTDGVPLFVEEITKAIIESGVLTDAGDRYTLTGPLPALAIPTSLHASLMARLDRLAPARDVAQIGAAIGRQFSHELISAVAPLSSKQLDAALERLVGAELIFRRGTPPNAEYTFKHALVQDAAYATLLWRQQQQLHGRIVAALEGQFPEIVAAQPERLAQHCVKAGLTEKAIGYWLAAGRQALARSAMAEAVAQLKKGLDLLATLPESAWRRRHELDFQIALGRALIATDGYAAPVTGETYARARQLCEQLDRPQELVPVLYGQYVHHLIRAEHELARPLAAEMRHLGEARNDVTLRLMGCRISGAGCFFLGELSASRAYLERGVALFDSAHRPFYATLTVQDARVTLLTYLSKTLFCLGHLDQARAWNDEALADAHKLSHAFTQGAALSHACWIERIARHKLALRERAEALIALSTEQNFPFFRAIGTVYRGWSLVAPGREEEGIALLNHGLSAYRAAGSVVYVPFFLTLLADAYGSARRSEEGLERLDEAAFMVEATHERWAEPEMHRVRGQLLMAKGDHGAAEESFRAALAVAERQSAKLSELRAAADLARLWRHQGKRAEACGVLAPSYGWFREGLDTADLNDAKTLLDELT